MNPVLQSHKTGKLRVADALVPTIRTEHVLVRTVASLVSVGTEKYMLELARKSLLGKALT